MDNEHNTKISIIYIEFERAIVRVMIEASDEYSFNSYISYKIDNFYEYFSYEYTAKSKSKILEQCIEKLIKKNGEIIKINENAEPVCNGNKIKFSGSKKQEENEKTSELLKRMLKINFVAE